MQKLSSYERILRTYQHKDIDRVPIHDVPWSGTITRWKKEGMPEDCDWRDYFGVDKVEGIAVDITPRYEVKVLEDTDRYQIVTTPWGVTLKNFKEEDSTPEFLDFKVNTKEAWEKARERMIPSRDRIDWNYLKENHPKWRADHRWIEAQFWFGFDVTHSWMVGTEDLLVALIEEPEWAVDMFQTYLDMCIAQFDMIWDAGYTFDSIYWPDDMGYKNTAFFSTAMYRELLKPIHKRAVDWAHKKGIYAQLHSCGNIMKLLPDIIETGIDCLNPLEVKAGMDVIGVKERYGRNLVLHGGVNAQMWDKLDEILPVIDELIPKVAQDGGYIFASDHSIPNSVSLYNFKTIVRRVVELTTH
ncbi:uroporphyrinogen decarboxylase [Anaerotaenia torta]|uniref:uroporphyrinogen decarboxylase family protein n=1 Tax=Anaerotaenia torta TaxID=433293 RepID=UPI003D2198F6